MSKSRKEQFEGQLRDLQKDISTLSQKLSVPTVTSSHSFTGRSNEGDITAHTGEIIADINRSFGGTNVQTTEKGERMAQLLQEAHIAKRERDDAVFRLEQSKSEIENLRKGLQENAKFKVAYEHLKQDYESLKVSLESSERIRKQQKELINLLQKSHSVAVASDSGSVFSINSISSISHHGGNNGESSNGRGVDVSTASFAEENRDWLYKSAHINNERVDAHPVVVSNPQSSRRRSSSAGAISNGSSAMEAPRSATSMTATSERTKRTSRKSVNISTASIANTTGSGYSQTRRASTSSGPPAPSTKKKLRSKKSTTKHVWNPDLSQPAPSYAEIMDHSSSVVPSLSRIAAEDQLNSSAGAYSTTSAHILHQPAADTNMGPLLSGTDMGMYSNTSSHHYPGLSAASSYHYPVSATNPHYAYTDAVDLSTRSAGRPPRYPTTASTPSWSQPTFLGQTSFAAPLSNSSSAYDPRLYTSTSHTDHVPAAPAPPAVQSRHRTTLAPSTTRTPSPNTTIRRQKTVVSNTASSSNRNTSSNKARKSPALVRRMPGSSPARSSSKEERSRAQSTPSAAHVSAAMKAASPSSTFGSARRIL